MSWGDGSRRPGWPTLVPLRGLVRGCFGPVWSRRPWLVPTQRRAALVDRAWVDGRELFVAGRGRQPRGAAEAPNLLRGDRPRQRGQGSGGREAHPRRPAATGRGPVPCRPQQQLRAIVAPFPRGEGSTDQASVRRPGGGEPPVVGS